MPSNDVHKRAFWTNVWSKEAPLAEHISSNRWLTWDKKMEEADMLTERDLYRIREYVLVKGVWKMEKELIMKMAKEILRLQGETEPNCVEDLKQPSLLEEAESLVGGDRRKDYGHPKENFKDVAAMWDVILEPQQKITPLQVIQCMLALKLCRAKQGYKRDTFVDLAGYARCAELISE